MSVGTKRVSVLLVVVRGIQEQFNVYRENSAFNELALNEIPLLQNSIFSLLYDMVEKRHFEFHDQNAKTATIHELSYPMYRVILKKVLHKREEKMQEKVKMT